MANAYNEESVKDYTQDEKADQLTLVWVEEVDVNTGRVGAMYCFKQCAVNNN